MKIKSYVSFGIATISLGLGFTIGTSTVSAHTWYDGTPSAARGTWRTKSIYVSSIGMRNHANFKVKAHTISFSYNASSRITLRNTYWRKCGAHSYTIHGAWNRDDNFDHRITIKKLSSSHSRLYFDGRTITKGSGLPNSFYR